MLILPHYVRASTDQAMSKGAPSLAEQTAQSRRTRPIELWNQRRPKMHRHDKQADIAVRNRQQPLYHCPTSENNLGKKDHSHNLFSLAAGIHAPAKHHQPAAATRPTKLKRGHNSDLSEARESS
ncbi:hypothetical protein M9H77_33848 [Catharanthus roseus]|uniref:Uncharacterized protein n=1 Tax=Catharanthus roseus TaxID=4058 RepID=A0ACB9ZLB2_CATRO|nr:hypothetical protein M9H77_33848 [Catharanthus roseus]